MNKDLKDFQDGLYELYKELGSDKLFYYPLTPYTKPNIYGESLDKTYEEPIQLVGSIEPLTAKDTSNYTLDTLSSNLRGCLTVTIPYKCVQEIGIEDMKELDKGRLEINSKMYDIVLVTMEGTFLGQYSTCKFMCKEVY